MIAFLKRVFSLKNVFHLLGALSMLSLLLAYLNPLIHPETYGSLSLIGLAYPIILLFNILFLIMALIIKSRWSLVIGALLILGIRFHLRIFAIGGDHEIKAPYSIKVMSYNTHLMGVFDPVKSERYKIRDGIFDYLKKESPDIICLQEFYQQDNPTNFVTRDSIIEFLKIKDYHERYWFKSTGKSDFGMQNMGACILSKYPIIQKGNVSFEKRTNNFCIYVDIVVNHDTLRVFNAHLQSLSLDSQRNEFEDQTDDEFMKNYVYKAVVKANRAFPVRADQAEEIARHVAESPYPVIVCGDFNDTPMSYSYQQFSSILTDAFRNCSSGIGSTYSGTLPAGRIDYIFHSKSLQSTNFEIQDQKLSDHYAISCRIFPKQKDH